MWPRSRQNVLKHLKITFITRKLQQITDKIDHFCDFLNLTFFKSTTLPHGCETHLVCSGEYDAVYWISPTTETLPVEIACDPWGPVVSIPTCSPMSQLSQKYIFFKSVKYKMTGQTSSFYSNALHGSPRVTRDLHGRC